MILNPKDICFLVSYDANYNEMANISVKKNFTQYCKLHGYTLWEHKITELYEGRSAQWQKIKVSLEILQTRNFKWLFFIDTDCLIMHTPTKLETFIDENYSFILPSHSVKALDFPCQNEHGTDNIITSHFFVKNDKTGLRILKDIWDAKEWPKNLGINEFDYEGRQTRITIQKPSFKDKVKIIEEKSISQFWLMNSPFMVFRVKDINKHIWEPGVFSIHVTGYSTQKRIELLSDLNDFSSGSLVNWNKEGNSICFSPLTELNYVKISLLNSDRQRINYYELRDLSVNWSYYIYTSDTNQDFILETYDENNKLIGLKLLEN